MMPNARDLLALAAVLLCLACQSSAPPPAADTESAAPAAAPTGAPAHPPVSPHGNMQPTAPGTMNPHAAGGAMNPHAPGGGVDLSKPASAGGLTWNDAAPLSRRAPKSSMRAAEYGLAGDDKLELTVFYFGADQGGSVDANITRWLGQITQPDGSDTAKKAKRTTRKVGDIEVSLLEVAGTYSGGMMMPGAPPQDPTPDSMMLAAIAKGPSGPVFFKMTGPKTAVQHARGAFEQMIESLRAQ